MNSRFALKTIVAGPRSLSIDVSDLEVACPLYQAIMNAVRARKVYD